MVGRSLVAIGDVEGRSGDQEAWTKSSFSVNE